MDEQTLARYGLHWTGCEGDGCTEQVAVPFGTDTGRCPAHTPKPAIPTPPDFTRSTNVTAVIRVGNPDLTGICVHEGRNRRPVGKPVTLLSLTPADIAAAYYWHDFTHHRNVWLVGGPGGGNGDICNPCAGWNGKEKQPMTDGPRHDLCLKGKSRFRGHDCPCTHNKPHMRGVKLDAHGRWPTNPTGTPRRPTPTPENPTPPPMTTPHEALFTYTPDPEDHDRD